MFSLLRKTYFNKLVAGSLNCQQRLKKANRALSTLDNLTPLAGSTDIAEKHSEFMAVYPEVVKSLTEYASKCKSKDAVKLYEKALEYNLLTGKMKFGFSTMLIFFKLADETQLTPENIKLAQYLSWCVEMVASFGFMFDDIQDGSVTRRGKPCWYKLEEIGLGAINHGVMIENGVYHILKENFAQKDYYVQLLELFHEVNFTGAIGQSIELQASKSCVTSFSMEKYKCIVANKCTNFIYLPVEAAMHLCGFSDPEIFRQLRAILYEIGDYCQVINDFNDCFGDPKKMGKIGNDIQENRCSWLAVVCMERASEAQKEIMRECYGKTDPVKVAQEKQLYEELGLPNIYIAYKEEVLNMMKTRIEQEPDTVVGHFYKIFLPHMTSTNWSDLFGYS